MFKISFNVAYRRAFFHELNALEPKMLKLFSQVCHIVYGAEESIFLVVQSMYR